MAKRIFDNYFMNSRDYKILRADHCYHIYNRGNNKELIFIDDQDYFSFLKRLKVALFGASALPGFASRIRIKSLPAGAFTILSYCLMPNHYHFLIRQNQDTTIDRLISRVCTSYAKYFNLKYKRVGNLFQDTFKAKLIDSDAYLTYLSAYIHNNPANPLDYDYSSFKDYLGLRRGQLCDKNFILRMFDNDAQKYKNFVMSFNETYLSKIKDYLFEE